MRSVAPLCQKPFWCRCWAVAFHQRQVVPAARSRLFLAVFSTPSAPGASVWRNAPTGVISVVVSDARPRLKRRGRLTSPAAQPGTANCLAGGQSPARQTSGGQASLLLEAFLIRFFPNHPQTSHRVLQGGCCQSAGTGTFQAGAISRGIGRRSPWSRAAPHRRRWCMKERGPTLAIRANWPKATKPTERLHRP